MAGGGIVGRGEREDRREKSGEKSEQGTQDWDALLGRLGTPKYGK
mgnify:CR=1 FL=1